MTVIAEWLDDTTGFFDDERACACIPRLEIQFPISIQKTCCYATKIVGRRTHTSETTDMGDDGTGIVDIIDRIGSLVVRETGTEDTFVQVCLA